MTWVAELLHELRELRREIKLLLHFHRRRILCVGVFIQQENKMSNPAQLVTGKPAQAAASVSGSTDPSSISISWSSDNTAVLTIDSAGLITLFAPGQATIEAIASDSTGASGHGACFCTVSQAQPGILTVAVDVSQA